MNVGFATKKNSINFNLNKNKNFIYELAHFVRTRSYTYIPLYEYSSLKICICFTEKILNYSINKQVTTLIQSYFMGCEFGFRNTKFYFNQIVFSGYIELFLCLKNAESNMKVKNME